MTVQSTQAELGGLLETIRQRGAGGGTLLVRLRQDGGWEVKNPAEQPKVHVSQADMDMARKALAIGSDLKREWQLALLFAEHREAVRKQACDCRGESLHGNWPTAAPHAAMAQGAVQAC